MQYFEFAGFEYFIVNLDKMRIWTFIVSIFVSNQYNTINIPSLECLPEPNNSRYR